MFLKPGPTIAKLAGHLGAAPRAIAIELDGLVTAGSLENARGAVEEIDRRRELLAAITSRADGDDTASLAESSWPRPTGPAAARF